MNTNKANEYWNLSTIKKLERKAKDYNPDKGYVSFEPSKLFALNFVDDEISYKKIKKRADYYNLSILFAYDTILEDSNGDSWKGFEVVFLNNIQNPNTKIFEIMKKALKFIFPESYRSTEVSSGIYLDDPLLRYFDKSIPEIDIGSLLKFRTES